MQRDEEYISAIIEDMDDRFDTILEVLESLRHMPASLRATEERLDAMSETIGLLVPVLHEQQTSLTDVRTRMSKLESE